MHVKLGPIALQFLAELSRRDTDVAARSTTLAAKARELKGRGSATATIRPSVEAAGAATTVTMVTDLQIQGSIAQYGRGVVSDVAAQLTERFAACLAQTLDAAEPAAGACGRAASTSGTGSTGWRAGLAPPVAPASTNLDLSQVLTFDHVR